jgi:hypothetical protein
MNTKLTIAWTTSLDHRLLALRVVVAVKRLKESTIERENEKGELWALKYPKKGTQTSQIVSNYFWNQFEFSCFDTGERLGKIGKIPDFTRQRVFHETSQETSVASI